MIVLDLFFFFLQEGLCSLPYPAALAVRNGNYVDTSGVNSGEH